MQRIDFNVGLTEKKMKNIFFTLTVTVIIFLTACEKPTNGCFTYSPTTITTATVVTFNSSCSENASYFTWNFGDNSADTIVTSLTVTHKFSAVGQFTVTLNAKRKDGWSLKNSNPITTQTITVQ